MRSKTILAAAFGLTVFAPFGASALNVPGSTLAAPSDLILAQVRGAKDEEEGAKKGKGERPERDRDSRQKSEQPPAATKSQAAPPEDRPQRTQETERPRRDAPPERGASPDRGTQPDRGTPPDRGADKAKQDAAEAARREEAGRRAKQESDAKAAAEQKAKSDAERSRTDARSKSDDDKAAQKDRTKQDPRQTDDRFGRDKDKDRDDRFGRDKDKDRDDRFGRDKDKDRDDRFGRDKDKDRDDRFGRDKDRDRDGDRTRSGERDGRDRDRDRNEDRERARRREAEKTSRDELSRTRIDEGRRITIDGGSRTIIRENNRFVIRGNDSDRFRHRRGDRRVERLPDGRERTIYVYPDGTQIVTVYGPRGEIVYRARRARGGREIVLIREVGRPPLARVDLGPLQLRIPRDQYIVNSRGASRRDIAIALSAPPVEPVERVYSLEEVRSFDRIRDKMRRIDITDITFDTDSAVITEDQAGTLEELADVINDLIDKNPGESFLIEGHTDAVGSDVYNLALSDRRAEAVAIALTDYFDVPPENLVTQGYGESFLKIPTEEPERENRRVAVRRITPLVSELRN